MTIYTIDDLFVNKDPLVREIYAALVNAISDWEGVRFTPKKTSIHIDWRTSFAGIHPRKKYINLNIRTAAAIDSIRVIKQEQVSQNRFHNLICLNTVSDVDDELIGWLRDGYMLSQ
ncbi:MAG: hypothetical protein KC643_25855 [Nitrospira sp.]|nr:hypothetical protein [Nitrospira sp.]MCB1714951.1 DNA replication protein DnaC [Candidatus Competibacteraceae bacterium]HQU27778.1 DUF5655 domain-containing protein [Nitrospirales bacterium]